MNEKIESLKGKLIVSCQALPHEPLHSAFIMGRMALLPRRAEHMASAPIPRRISLKSRPRLTCLSSAS